MYMYCPLGIHSHCKYFLKTMPFLPIIEFYIMLVTKNYRDSLCCIYIYKGNILHLKKLYHYNNITFSRN